VIENENIFKNIYLTETQVNVEQSSETTVEITTEERTVEETTEIVMEHKQVAEEHHEEHAAIHLTKDEIDEFEESQAKFRELWEKKREKVRVVGFDFFPFV
jgi:hypothetical protein